jgi:hypothetical protein
VRPAVVLARLFYVEPASGRIGDVADSDVEPGCAPLRGVVVERDVAVDSVPLTGEPDCQLLGDIEGSVGVNGEQRIEVADADGATLRARGAREREKEEKCPTNC